MNETINSNDFLKAITSENIEITKGIQYNSDGTYIVKKSRTLKELMVVFQEWWDVVNTLKLTSDNAEETHIKKTNIGIEGNVNIRSAFDSYGHAFINGIECPICGNRYKYLKVGGYCSTQCALKSISNKAVYFLLSPNERYKKFDRILDGLISILDQTTLVLNALMAIPNILVELAEIPQEYKDYIQKKINLGFCYLQECVQTLMMKFNEKLKQLLKPIKLGWISKPISYVFTAINAIVSAMEIAQKAFDAIYNTLIKTLQKLKITGVCIYAEGIAWTATPRSFIGGQPFTSPDVSKIFVNLPGGLGLQNVLLTKPLMPSAMQNINLSSIDSFINKLFPPLTPLDYYLEPPLFDVRYMFSDQSGLILSVRQQLEDFLTFGFDYVPKYENLFPVKKFTNWMGTGKNVKLPNIAYAWFLLALLDGWAPHSKALVGSLIYPFL